MPRTQKDPNRYLPTAPTHDAVILVATGLIRPADRVLEVGCGLGGDAIYYAQQGCDVIAVDESPAAIEYAQAAQKARSGSEKRAEFKKEDVRFVAELAENGERFHVVSDRLLLSNLSNSVQIRRYLQGVHKLIRRGGLFLIRWSSGAYVGDTFSFRQVFKKRAATVTGLFRSASPLRRLNPHRRKRHVVIPMLPNPGGWADAAVLLVLRPKRQGKAQKSVTKATPKEQP